RAGPPFAQQLDGLRAAQSKISQNQAGDQRRAIKTHAAMRQHLVAAFDQAGPEPRDGVQLVQIGQVVIVDRKIEVERMVEHRRHAAVEVTFKVYYDRDAMLFDNFPLVHSGRKEQACSFIKLKDFHMVSDYCWTGSTSSPVCPAGGRPSSSRERASAVSMLSIMFSRPMRSRNPERRMASSGCSATPVNISVPPSRLVRASRSSSTCNPVASIAGTCRMRMISTRGFFSTRRIESLKRSIAPKKSEP